MSGVTAWLWDGDQWIGGPTPPPIPAFDFFERPNHTSSLGTADSGQAWIVHAGTCGIIDGQGYAAALASAQAIATVDAGVADLDATIDIHQAGIGPPNTKDDGFIFRAVDHNTHLMARINSETDAYQIFKRVSGTYTLLASGASTDDPTHQLRLVAEGDSIDLYIDRVLRLSHTLSGADQTAFGDKTRVGFRLRSTSSRVNNLRVANP